MADLTLYHAAPSRSSVVRWMLEELGQPYDVHLLKLANGDQAKPDYLAINPMGKVPALKHGDAVVTEVAAICTYLADEFPHARLNIPVGDPRRGAYLKWLFFSPSCIEPAVTDRAFPRKEDAALQRLCQHEVKRACAFFTRCGTSTGNHCQDGNESEGVRGYRGDISLNESD